MACWKADLIWGPPPPSSARLCLRIPGRLPRESLKPRAGWMGDSGAMALLSSRRVGVLLRAGSTRAENSSEYECSAREDPTPAFYGRRVLSMAQVGGDGECARAMRGQGKQHRVTGYLEGGAKGKEQLCQEAGGALRSVRLDRITPSKSSSPLSSRLTGRLPCSSMPVGGSIVSQRERKLQASQTAAMKGNAGSGIASSDELERLEMIGKAMPGKWNHRSAQNNKMPRGQYQPG